MRHSLPRLLNIHRWELSELKEQLAVLSRLRSDMEQQQRALSGDDGEDARQRRTRLEQSLAQLDDQIKGVQEQINGRVRAVRLLESSPRGKSQISSGTAEAV